MKNSAAIWITGVVVLIVYFTSGDKKQEIDWCTAMLLFGMANICCVLEKKA